MKNPTRTSLISVTATFALVFLGTAAQADTADSLTKIVSYSDLNVDSPAGAKVLNLRLRSAAQGVCLPLNGRSLREQSAFRSCIDKAVIAAVVAINKPALSALYNNPTSLRLAAK